MQPSPSKPQVPFIRSEYLGREVMLDELADLSDQELQLLETEADGVRESCSALITKAIEANTPYGSPEKLLRVAGRFLYAIEREVAMRQKQSAYSAVLERLAAVTSERNALRVQLDHLLTSSK